MTPIQNNQFENKLRIELRGHPDSKLWGDAGLIAATMRSVDAIDEVIEQRDRLAEAIRKHKFDDVKLWQALQSLNQPTEL